MGTKLNFEKDAGRDCLAEWINGGDAWWEARFWDGENEIILGCSFTFGTNAMQACQEHFDANKG